MEVYPYAMSSQMAPMKQDGNDVPQGAVPRHSEPQRLPDQAGEVTALNLLNRNIPEVIDGNHRTLLAAENRKRDPDWSPESKGHESQD